MVLRNLTGQADTLQYDMPELLRELGCGFMMPTEGAIGNCLLRSLGL